MRLAAAIGALVLAGCASCPMPAPVPAIPRSVRESPLASEGYALSGKVISLLAAGKIAAPLAVSMSSDLRTAQADLRAGKTAAAKTLIDGVKARLPGMVP